LTFYRRNLPHLQRGYKPHFITFVTKNRRVLTSWERQIVFDCCTHDHGKRYNLRVAVVMPDHVHIILTPLTDEIGWRIFRLPEIMKAIKATSSHAINRRLGRHDVVWQEESFDHVLRSAERLDAKIDYILQNPVRAGLMGMASEYPWSWRKPIESPYSPAIVPIVRPEHGCSAQNDSRRGGCPHPPGDAQHRA
jgi:REP element-mobilizing transposase RayT